MKRVYTGEVVAALFAFTASVAVGLTVSLAFTHRLQKPASPTHPAHPARNARADVEHVPERTARVIPFPIPERDSVRRPASCEGPVFGRMNIACTHPEGLTPDLGSESCGACGTVRWTAYGALSPRLDPREFVEFVECDASDNYGAEGRT
ncbi:DUF6255 family natural product biosynthesis protein [Streptomyces sp. NPDC050617]|uniref:DUF6255 family natural product biosynthesis protein n=1 Tax=Streptomyces sp. NPDC050617 TaxID=3154628 RepID=UPI0034437A7B